MLKICTVFFKGFYPSSYVARLYDSLKKHTTLDFEFVCLSDDPNVKADVILPYNHHSNVVKHWQAPHSNWELTHQAWCSSP